MACITPGKLLNQIEATNLDLALFNDYKFSVDQLMELAGLSVAIAVAKCFSTSEHHNILVVCGPGNNGGDGLVAARHLSLFGFKPAIYYPKRTQKPLYENLLTQCVKYGIRVIDSPLQTEEINNDYNVIVDALFGFSFKPPIREEMKPLMNALINTTVPICSVDIPSGWDVNTGPPSEPHIKPKVLVSLSAPKLCSKYLNGAKHYLGGRFIPPQLAAKYELNLPKYPGTEQVVDLCTYNNI